MQQAPLGAIERPTTPASLTSRDALRAEYERIGAWGLLASIDLHECDAELITSPEAIRKFVVELCDLIDMQRHGECLIERFGSGDLEGYSVFQFIETSCVSAHFDEKIGNAAYLDIFSCKYFDPDVAAEFAKTFFKSGDYVLRTTLRK